MSPLVDFQQKGIISSLCLVEMMGNEHADQIQTCYRSINIHVIDLGLNIPAVHKTKH